MAEPRDGISVGSSQIAVGNYSLLNYNLLGKNVLMQLVVAG